VISRLAFLIGAVNLSTFAVYFIQARLGFVQETAAQPASILMLIVGIFILLSALPGGWLADRFGHRRLVAFSGLAAALGTLIALLYPSLYLISAGGILIGVAAGIFFSANWALGAGLAPRGGPIWASEWPEPEQAVKHRRPDRRFLLFPTGYVCCSSSATELLRSLRTYGESDRTVTAIAGWRLWRIGDGGC
jgi:predicted MFS family arabinose efflux permease